MSVTDAYAKLSEKYNVGEEALKKSRRKYRNEVKRRRLDDWANNILLEKSALYGLAIRLLMFVFKTKAGPFDVSVESPNNVIYKYRLCFSDEFIAAISDPIFPGDDVDERPDIDTFGPIILDRIFSSCRTDPLTGSAGNSLLDGCLRLECVGLLVESLLGDDLLGVPKKPE